MKRIGVIANCKKTAAKSVLGRLAAKAAELDMTLVTAGPAAAFLSQAEKHATEADLSDQVDVLIALGGDGTMLHTVRTLTNGNTPVMGVNLGSLGFMTSVSQDNLESALEGLANGTFLTSIRTVADCTIVREDGSAQKHKALNDIVLGWGASSRIITLDLQINDEVVSAYKCDGIIVSTPTGSTGHSLSAAGPIIHPEARVLLINVLCPHTLGARPIVVPDENTITVTAKEMDPDKALILSIDGQTEERFNRGDRIVIRKNPEGVRFIHPPEYSYYSVLRQKLHLRGTNV